ncbi:MAG: hypothetical protein RLZZ282_1710 [Verrucomicrobiota bacterium]
MRANVECLIAQGKRISLRKWISLAATSARAVITRVSGLVRRCHGTSNASRVMLSVIQSGGHKPRKERMRKVRLGLELRMKLRANEKRMIGNLDNFH